MDEFLPFLQKYEVWIYVLLGAVALYYFVKLVAAWGDWQGTVFGIEREIAQRRFTASLTVLILLVLFVVLEFVIVSFVAPNYPQLAALSTPTIDVLATPTVTLSALGDGNLNASGGADPVAGASAGAGEPTATPTIDMASLKEGCEAGKIEWTFPTEGKEISATVELKGTVNVPNLGFYKYEYARPGEKNWTTIAAGNQPKVDGQIGFWNTSQLDPGDYMLRLVVADNQNQLFPACVVPVKVMPTQK